MNLFNNRYTVFFALSLHNLMRFGKKPVAASDLNLKSNSVALRLDLDEGIVEFKSVHDTIRDALVERDVWFTDLVPDDDGVAVCEIGYRSDMPKYEGMYAYEIRIKGSVNFKVAPEVKASKTMYRILSTAKDAEQMQKLICIIASISETWMYKIEHTDIL